MTEPVAPLGYDASEFPSFAVTVDIVLLTVVDGSLNALLIERGGQPYQGAWALPGGFKRPDETLEDAARRELREETGIEAPTHLGQLAAYGDPGRDPRANVVTIAYTAVVTEALAAEAATDATQARWWPLNEVLDGTFALAFDHDRILRDAVERARAELEQTSLAAAFVGPEFTLNELQEVYETVWGEQLDRANFRRALRSQDRPWVQPTGRRRSSGSAGGRPAELYRRGNAWDQEPPPVRRPKG